MHYFGESKPYLWTPCDSSVCQYAFGQPNLASPFMTPYSAFPHSSDTFIHTK